MYHIAMNIQNYQINLFNTMRILVLVMLVFFSSRVWADGNVTGATTAAPAAAVSATTATTATTAPAGFGQVADNVLEPIIIGVSFLSGISFVLGLTCLFSAFLRYMQHRVNPLAFPLSTIIVLTILGVFLVLLPWVYKLTDSGIPFSF